MSAFLRDKYLHFIGSQPPGRLAANDPLRAWSLRNHIHQRRLAKHRHRTRPVKLPLDIFQRKVGNFSLMTQYNPQTHMSNAPTLSSRREFIKTTGRIATISALAGIAIPQVHAAGNETLQLALIGCGGRGTGAAANALSVNNGSIKLVAMADVFADRLNGSHDALSQKYGDKMDAPSERRFIGFDGYQKAMDCLKPGDIVILTTPLAFRWVHFRYAIQKGLHVFMEKPLTADGPSSRRMLQLAQEASAKQLKVGVGLMCRHSRALQQLAQRLHDGAIGDIILMRGYRMQEPIAACFSEKWPGGSPTELLWQISRFHSFIWASGGLYNDFYIHHIDRLCWMKNDWPVKCQALGGRHYRTTPEGRLLVDQNFDSYSVEYTFADGAKMYMDGRCVQGCADIYSTTAHGSKGLAVVTATGDDGPCSIHPGQLPKHNNAIWTSKVNREEIDAYQNEWNDLVDAIRNDKPYNEVARGVQASVVSSMGRLAAHTGQEVTYDEMLNHPDEYAPNADKFTMDSPPPLRSAADGSYPVPMPGIITRHEYAIS
jgi:predicted dehydrogenase